MKIAPINVFENKGPVFDKALLSINLHENKRVIYKCQNVYENTRDTQKLDLD